MIQKDLTFEGPGLHTGVHCRCRIEPRQAVAGVPRFIFTTAMGSIPALVEHAEAVDFRTVLANGRARVETVEHLLAALVITAIPAAEIFVEGPEIPILDGSALPFATALMDAGFPELEAGPDLSDEAVDLPSFEVRRGESFVRFIPGGAAVCDIEYTHPHPLVGRRRLEIPWTRADLVREIAPARTFGFHSDREALTKAGLIRGVSLENCVIFGETELENPGGLRFPDEPLRHKLLDLLGDLALCGRPIRGRLDARNPGHALNRRAAERAANLTP